MVDTKDKGMHPVVADADKLRSSGKEVGQANPPIVSVQPSSGKTVQKSDQKREVIDDGTQFLTEDTVHDQHEFGNLESGQGLFLATEVNKTTDELIEKLQKSIYNINNKYSVIAVDENGDEILENLTIKVRKRNEDGTLQLNDGQVITGANMVQRPKRIFYRQFAVKPVVKDDVLTDGKKAPGDGALVIRVI